MIDDGGDFRLAIQTSRLHGGQPVLSVQQLRTIEQAHADVDLMRRAGEAAAAWLTERLQPGENVLIVAGPGNNGGDGLACAARLAQLGHKAYVVLLADPATLPEDAAEALQRWQALGGNYLEALPEQGCWSWVVDALFGIGLKRPLDGVYREAARKLPELAKDRQVLALDIPSGLDADTGARLGDSAVVARATLSFIAAKPGLVTGEALEHVGEVYLADLGLPPSQDRMLTTLDLDVVRTLQPGRPITAHKGTQGCLHVLGGASGMRGAALLAARAGLRAGAGKVRLGWLGDSPIELDLLYPELMMSAAETLLGPIAVEATALCIGCGWGDAGPNFPWLYHALEQDRPAVIDADALNRIAESAELARVVQKRCADTILTPHPKEAARLLGTHVADVQANRIKAACDLARGYHAVTVLKGAGSVIAHPEGQACINLTGNPLLATAGTGDVLAGIIGGLLAQGLSAWDAARVGVTWHGACADRLAQQAWRRAVAGDLLQELCRI